jgi:hypothetical protein
MSEKDQTISVRQVLTALGTLAVVGYAEPYILDLHSLWYWPYLVLAQGIVLFIGALFVLRVRRFLKPYMAALISAAAYVMYLLERGLFDVIVAVVKSGALWTTPGMILFFYPFGLLVGMVYLQVVLGVWSVQVMKSKRYEP